MSTKTSAGPLPSVPKGGSEANLSTAGDTPNALSSVPTSDVYLALVEYKVQPGKAKEFAEGIDATQGCFYRKQPGCLVYMFGLSNQDHDTVLGTAIWTSKALFDSLPKNLRDLEKLNEARAPFKSMVEDVRIVDTGVTFGIGHQKHNVKTADEEPEGWDRIMGTYGRRSVLPAVSESNVYMVHVEMKAQPGRGEEVAKGLEATQGRFCKNNHF